MKMGVLVHPQLGLRFGAALPGAFFFSEEQHFYEREKKTCFLCVFSCFLATCN